MKKGFSLIELLGVISILAVLTIIGAVSINSLIQKGKNDAYEIIKKSATTSLKLWGSDNLLFMPEENEAIYMTLYQLKLLGYVKDLKNPKTNNYVSNNSLLTITNNNGYQYNIVIDDNEETSNNNLPSLSFEGDIFEKVELNSQYTLPTSTGTDSNGNDISSSITTSIKKVVNNELVSVDSVDTSSIGLYLIYYTYNNVSIIKNILVKDYNNEVTSAKVYGLRWDGNETYTRLEDAEGMVANAGVGAIPATNDFDNAEIYKDIEDVTVDGNVFVKIPKFYIKKVVMGDTWEWYVSKDKGEGYYLPECFKNEAGNELDYVLIGKYDASLNGTKLESKSGATPTVSISMDDFRTYAVNNNTNGVTGYQLFDIHAYDVVQVLFYVEFATVNSQNIMYGYAASSNSAKVNNGTTDTVVATSGSTSSNTDGLSAMKYRGIENLWGNIFQWVDGLYINNTLTEHNIFVNKKPSTYANYSSTDYYYVGYNKLNSDGYISKMGYDEDNPFIQLPTEVSGTSSTKYADYYWRTTSGNTVMRVGGRWNIYTTVGLSAISVDNTSTNTLFNGGARLMKKPL